MFHHLFNAFLCNNFEKERDNKLCTHFLFDNKKKHSHIRDIDNREDDDNNDNNNSTRSSNSNGAMMCKGVMLTGKRNECVIDLHADESVKKNDIIHHFQQQQQQACPDNAMVSRAHEKGVSF